MQLVLYSTIIVSIQPFIYLYICKDDVGIMYSQECRDNNKAALICHLIPKDYNLNLHKTKTLVFGSFASTAFSLWKCKCSFAI